MTKAAFKLKLKQLQSRHQKLIGRRSRPAADGNGIF